MGRKHKYVLLKMMPSSRRHRAVSTFNDGILMSQSGLPYRCDSSCLTQEQDGGGVHDQQAEERKDNPVETVLTDGNFLFKCTYSLIQPTK